MANIKRWYLLIASLVAFDILILSAYWYVNTRTLPAIEIKDTLMPSLTPIPTPEPVIKLILVGDIMLGRSVNMRSLDMGNTNYPFEKVGDRLRGADIVFANFESPIVTDCPRIEHGYLFCADPAMAGGLVYSEIDMVSIANNHNLNFGQKGFEDTKKYLTANNIKWVGDGNLQIVEKQGIKFSFLGFDKSQQEFPQISSGEIKLVKDSANEADLLVVGMHWGTEYQDSALPGVRKLAKELIKNGADIIAGHHPHWVQDIKYIDPNDNFNESETFCAGCKPVYYSLGNFIFDQMWSEKTRQGLAVELTLENDQIIREDKIPSYIREWAQPEWVSN